MFFKTFDFTFCFLPEAIWFKKLKELRSEKFSKIPLSLNFKYDYNIIESPNASDTIQLSLNTNDTIDDIKSKLFIKEKSIPQNLMKFVDLNCKINFCWKMIFV